MANIDYSKYGMIEDSGSKPSIDYSSYGMVEEERKPSKKNKIEKGKSPYQRFLEANQNPMQELEPFGGGGEAGRKAAIEGAAMAVPSLRAGKYLSEGAPFLAKALANYGGAIGQNVAIGGAANALEGEDAGQGALIGGATTAAVHPIASLLASPNPTTRALLAGALAGGGAYGLQKQTGVGNTYTDLLAGAAGTGLGLAGRGARNMAALRTLKGVNLEDAKPRLEAAERLGLKYLTPAEATGIPYVGQSQGNLGGTFESSKLLHEKSQERLGTEQKAIEKFINTTWSDKQLAPQLKEAYLKSYDSSVSPEFLQEIKKSAIIDKAFNKVNKNPAFKDALENVPEHNFAYLDQVKRAMDDMYGVASRAGKNNEARLIKNKINDLVGEMDAINPQYAEARALAQRKIVTDEIKDVLGQKKISGSQFFNKFLSNENKYKELFNSLKNVPEAQDQLKDMKLAFEHLINPHSARAASKLAATSMDKSRSTSQNIIDFVKKLQGGKYDTAGVNLITDPKWADELSRIKELNSNSDKTQSIANLLSRASGRKMSEKTNE